MDSIQINDWTISIIEHETFTILCMRDSHMYTLEYNDSELQTKMKHDMYLGSVSQYKTHLLHGLRNTKYPPTVEIQDDTVQLEIVYYHDDECSVVACFVLQPYTLQSGIAHLIQSQLTKKSPVVEDTTDTEHLIEITSETKHKTKIEVLPPKPLTCGVFRSHNIRSKRITFVGKKS